MQISDEWWQRLYHHALANYETDGWDYLVESIDKAEVEAELDETGFTPTDYLQLQEFVKGWVSTLDSHRRDIQGTAF